MYMNDISPHVQEIVTMYVARECEVYGVHRVFTVLCVYWGVYLIELNHATLYMVPLKLMWVNFNPNMDKQSHVQ